MMISKIVLVASLFIIAKAAKFPFRSCGSEFGKFDYVTSAPCLRIQGMQHNCIFQKGNIQTINIGFTPRVNMARATLNVTAFVNNPQNPSLPLMPFPFKLPQSDICLNSNECPLIANQPYEYSFEMEVLFPEIRVIVQFVLQDEKGRNIACFRSPIVVADRNRPPRQ